MTNHTHPTIFLYLLYALAALCLFAGCAPALHEVDAFYLDTSSPQPRVPEAQGKPLYLAPVTGYNSSLWYSDESGVWVLKRLPTAIVRDALILGMQSMRFEFVETPSESRARLHAMVRWLAPYGHDPLTAVAIVSLALYSADGMNLLWWGRIQAGRINRPAEILHGDQSNILEEIFSSVLTRAVKQLRWNPELRQALSIL